MIKIWILLLSMLGISGCKQGTILTVPAQVDSLSSMQFLSDKNICSLALARDFREISPPMVPWATDPNDPYSESYMIDGKKLTIIQPLKRFDLPDSNRRYFYEGKAIKITRVLFDSLKFNFNDISFDYGYSPQNIFQKDNYILLRNEPVNWTGSANTYRFIQLFDLKKFVCNEFFVNYYACLNENPSLERLK
ncbi:hypothetical protein OCK74_08860 [Chitinophagaceae bacterium LB-8]|uniref:Lipoprotein n=1 Tax=Paraflavisolibacter caeni TaxID=2982496 RepID=A0A9X2XNV8_9BACT|nr:hypothetical protein [Paraflavisolibacter caeni]MCU7549224.1 hypothetical protein [Paraflavisolibacter caeni]